MSRLVTDKLKEWAFFALLFLVPIYYVVNMGDTRVAQERFFQLAGMVLASIFFGNIWLTLFFFLNVILFVVYGSSTGSAQVTNVFMTGLLFACSRNFFRERSLNLRPLFIVTALSLIYCIFQFFRIDPIGAPISAAGVPDFNGNSGQLNGLFFHTAFHSVFLAMMLPAFIFSGIWVAAPLIPLILWLKCSGAILATAFTVPFIAYHTKRKLFLPVLVITAILGVGGTYMDFKTDKLTYLSRFESWHMVVKFIMVRPWGWGPDSFRNKNNYKNFTFESDEDYNPLIVRRHPDRIEYVYHSADPSKFKTRFDGRVPKNWAVWLEAHNEPLQFFFEYGIIGLLIIGFFIKEFFDRYVLSNKSREVLILFAMIMAIFISGVTQFPFHLARLTGIFGILLGAYWAKTDKSYLTIKGED